MDERPRTNRPLTPDERAYLDTLVREIGPRLLAYVRKAFGRRIDAEEVVAETFCRAAVNIASVRGCERQDIYLLTIARNLCRDVFRRPGVDVVSDERLAARPGQQSGAHERLAAAERTKALGAALAALPESQREIVVLRISAGLKFEEIAKLLNVPLGTALSRMHAAVQRMKTELGEHHDPRAAVSEWKDLQPFPRSAPATDL